MDVRTWLQLTLCLREVKGEEQTCREGEDFPGSRNMNEELWMAQIGTMKSFWLLHSWFYVHMKAHPLSFCAAL